MQGQRLSISENHFLPSLDVLIQLLFAVPKGSAAGRGQAPYHELQSQHETIC